MNSWHSYPSIFALGHGAVKELFNGPTVIEEKIDGSQFSFGVICGELKMRSKGVQLYMDNPEKMFLPAMEWVANNAGLFELGHTYRCEYLKTPKHNTLAYDRIPANHLIVFDINTAQEVYMSYEDKKKEAERIGLECVPRFEMPEFSAEACLKLLENVSILGGQKIEGFVVKNYTQFGKDKKALMGKYVSEAFKEVHKGEWKSKNPGGVEFFDNLAQSYRSEARWNKAVQHLRDRGELTDSPKDIGALMKEVACDILKECEEEIKEKCFKHAWSKVSRTAGAGLAEWYKKQLLEKQFEGGVSESVGTNESAETAS